MDTSITSGDIAVLFIGGTGRCGTNVSKELLGHHPQVATLPFEYRFLIDPDGLVDFYCGYTACWSPYLADRRLKRLERFLDTLAEEQIGHRVFGRLLRFFDRDGKVLSPRRYHGWNLDVHLPGFKQHSHALMNTLREFSFPGTWVGTESYSYRPRIYHAGPQTADELANILGGFIYRVLSDFLAARDRRVYVEDNTWNILFARELLQLVPGAKILHIYRDPRDVVASFVQQRWSPTDVEQASRWYRSIMQHWFTVREALSPGAYLECRLEDLVDATEHTVREVCRFAGLPYDPVLLTMDLSGAHSGRWLRDLSRDEQKKVHAVLEEVIARLGYE